MDKSVLTQSKDVAALQRHFLDAPRRRTHAHNRVVLLINISIAWLVIWASVGGFLWQQHVTETKNADLESKHLSFVTALNAEQTLTVNELVVDSMLDWIADENIQTEADYRRLVTSREFFDRLKARIDKLPSIDVATFIATDGTILNYTRGYPPAPTNLRDRDYFIEQMAANAPSVSLGKSVQNRGTGGWTFYLAKAVYGSSGDKLGVAIVGAGVPYFTQQFTRMLRHYDDSGRAHDNAFLVRKDGVMLAASSMVIAPGSYLTPYTSTSDTERSALPALLGSLKLPQDTTISVNRLETFPAFIMAVTDNSARLIEWRGYSWWVGGFGAALSLLSAVIAWLQYHMHLNSEKLLRQQGEQRILSSIFQSPLALAALVTPDGRIIYCNDVFSDLMKDIIRDKMLVPTPEVDGSDALVSSLENESTATDVLVHAQGKNGQRIHLRFMSARVDFNQGDHAIALLGQDDTDRIKVQAHLIQSSKLITLGEMATGMAHELNQPLNVIKMAAQSALCEIEECGIISPDANAAAADPVKTVQVLETRLHRVVEQVDRAAVIIDHMRIFGRLPSGVPPLIDVAYVCQGALQLIGHQLRDAQIRTVFRLDENSHSVKFHAVLLEQVLVNLLLNARDSLVEVAVQKREIRVEVKHAGGEVIVLVSDTGSGILPAYREKIFDPFFTTKPPEKGTGLGLSISYGIVRDSGGRIELLDTSPGCTFCIFLPAAVKLDTQAE